MHYSSVAIETNKQWRGSTRAESSKRGGILAKSNASPVGNGDTAYGEVKAGTILAKDTAGLLHPLGLAKVSAAVTAANDVTPDNANGFNKGDLCSVLSGASRTKSITNNSVVLSIVTKIAGLNLIIAVAGNSTVQKCVYNPVNKTITFTAATDGGGAATSTHADLVSELIKLGALIESASSATPATLVAALATTALERVKYETIVSARTITVKASGVLTLSGAVFTAAEDDIILKDGAYKPVGILDSAGIVQRIDGATVTPIERPVDLAVEGDARDSSTYVPNIPAAASVAGVLLRRALGGHVYPDPVGGADVVPDAGLVGFRFLSI